MMATIETNTYMINLVNKLKQQNRELGATLEKLFRAYETLDEDTMPENTLPLERIQDIMPEIEQALAQARK